MIDMQTYMDRAVEDDDQKIASYDRLAGLGAENPGIVEIMAASNDENETELLKAIGSIGNIFSPKMLPRYTKKK